jgi:hypothetical protein
MKDRTTQRDREVGEINKRESEDRKARGRERKGKHIIRIYEKSLSFSGSIAVQHLKHSINNVIHPKDINSV